MLIEPRQRTLLKLVWRQGRLSRSAMHEHTGMRLNTVGAQTAALIEQGILRECDAKTNGRGRPRVPLEIDPTQRHVIGVALRPHGVQRGRIDLLGEPIDPPVQRDVPAGKAGVRTAAAMLGEMIGEQTLAVGLTTPGFIDVSKHQILYAASMPSGETVSLEPLYEVAGDTPIALENDAHALAAHWVLIHPDSGSEDTLIVLVGDGQLGASLLIDGKPNRGSVNGANELGHTRLPVDTPPNNTGRTGCLENICSSGFLRMLEPSSPDLAEAVARFNGLQRPVIELSRLLGLGLANAVNFTRIRRLVLVSELLRHDRFAQQLIRDVRRETLGQLDNRLKIDLWDRPASEPATTAGSLVLAHLYCDSWDSLLTVTGQVRTTWGRELVTG